MNGENPKVTSATRRSSRALLALLATLLAATGLIVWPSPRPAATAGAQQGALPILNPSVRFRIVAPALATPNPAAFSATSSVVPNHRAVDITDLVLQNPRGDTGALRIQIGDEVILEENLATFRHLQINVPVHVNADQPVVVAVNCALPGPPEPVTGRCTPAVSFFG